MALNKYTFWDLTEQAVPFQTASEAACLKQLVQSSARHMLGESSRPPLTPALPVHHCVSRAEVFNPPGYTLEAPGQLSAFLRSEPDPRPISSASLGGRDPGFCHS